MTKSLCLGVLALAVAGCGMMKDKMPSTGSSGMPSTSADSKLPGGCDNDQGVEQMGKEMDAKVLESVIASQNSLAYMYDAAGKKADADKARAMAKKWQDNKDKAPTGMERINAVKGATENIQKESDSISATGKNDAATQTALKSARMELRKALVYAAWGSKIGQPVPEKAKAAIEANKTCAAKVKPAADAAAGLSTLLGKMKATYGSVDGAVKKAGGGEMTEAEKRQQESETGAPAGLGV